MGDAHEPEKVTLICGLLAGDPALLPAARAGLVEAFGALDATSAVWPFATTEYYAAEMGPAIVRQFVSFADPFAMDRLAEVKLATNALEREIARAQGGDRPARPVNLDPGYVTLGSLVLATTKDRAHRIYLGRGIFAEVTLGYEAGGWRAWPWTYPDYAAPTYHPFFTQVREDLKRRRRAGRYL